ncbi:hypothetical protein ACFE33_11985 [Falsihalocynthiibacter sp. SS001]|uniref:hypothetical protein n=1 Tax=Falsihalocynthiibacter sp. SS001 TaxID=3349698 RepID=UPI0036D3BF53
MSAAQPSLLRRVTLTAIVLFFGVLIGAMGRAIAVQLGIGFVAAPLWFAALILIYMGTILFRENLLRWLAPFFRLSTTEPDHGDKRINLIGWSVFLVGCLVGYLLTAFILIGES